MGDPIATKKSHRVYQVIDLKEEFGVSFAKNQALKQRISQALIDKMKERIDKGLDVNGEPMKQYSAVYQHSPEYIAARKTGVVNMTLSGDMMGAIDVVKEDRNKITLGFNQQKEELKANRHMRGEGGVPVREFFGIGEDEISAVKKEFSSELDDLKPSTNQDNTSSKTLEQLRLEAGAISSGFGSIRIGFGGG
jgi:sRNA-binding protein